MDQHLDKSKPPPTYSETFRRHRKLFCAPIILGALVAAVFLLGKGQAYTATASLWVDTAPPAPSSIGADSGPLIAPPAAAEQAILSELLMTRSFANSVVKRSLLGKSGGTGDAIRQNAKALGHVIQWTPGGQVLQISYSASSPAIAKSVVGAVIAQLRTYTDSVSVRHGQAAVAYDKEQVKAAGTALATARSNVTAYQAQHPGVTATDPNYLSLVATKNDAVTQLNKASAALSQATGASNAAAWSVQVIDPPNQVSTAPLRKSKIAELMLGGALAGLLVSFMAVVALTPVKKEVWEDELPIGGPFVPDVPPADPFPPRSPGVPAALIGERHLQVRTTSAPTEEQ